MRWRKPLVGDGGERDCHRQSWGPGRVIPGKRAKEVTHVIGVEAFAHARRHIESALQRTEPHHVWNVVAEKPQSPEPREKGASSAVSCAPLHCFRGGVSSGLQSQWKPRTQALCASRGTILCRVPKRFRSPLPIA